MISNQKQKRLIDLDNLFNPESIAIIGASNNPTKIGGRPIRYLLNYKYRGKIIPINPNYNEIQGVPCYPSVSEVPYNIDLALIALPAKIVPDVIEECGKKGVKNAVIFSSGFSEVGEKGRELQEKLKFHADYYGINICGPNTVGIISEPNRVIASFATSLERSGLEESGEIIKGNTSFISQSGAFGAFIYTMANDQGLGFKHFVAVGNEADLEVGDFLGYMTLDKDTKAVGGYLEGIKDGKRFLEAVDMAIENGKPLTFVKVGRSEGGKKAAQSHTGSLAGSDEIYNAVFKQKGIFRASDVQQMLDFLTLCGSIKNLPEKKGVGIMSISGGMGVWAADRFEDYGISLPDFSTATKNQLIKVLPDFGSSNNPVDFTAQVLNQPDILKECIRTILDDPNIDTLLIIMGLQEKHGEKLARDIVEAVKDTDKLVVLTWMVGPVQAYQVLNEANIPVFDDMSRCVNSVAGVINCGVHISKAKKDLNIFEKNDNKPVQVKLSGDMHEHKAKRVLSEWGLAVPEGKLVTSKEDAVRTAGSIGFPVVLKVQSAKLLHKTEYGLVKVNLESLEEVQDAYSELENKAFQLIENPQDFSGILVEKMVPQGREVIIGAIQDNIFGPVIMFGLGGILVEALKDVSFRLAPVNYEEALSMIKDIKGSVLLNSFRGGPEYDTDALADTIVKFSQFINANEGIVKEAEINPLMVLPRGEGVVIVDALIKCANNQKGND